MPYKRIMRISALLLLASVAAAFLFVGVSCVHNCHGDGCKICAALNLFRSAFCCFAAFCAFLALEAAIRGESIKKFFSGFREKSPVALRDRLLD